MAGESFFKYAPDPLSVAMRPRCSACGAAGLRWMAPASLAAAVPAASRGDVVEWIRAVGGDGDAWLCPACGEFGLLGGSGWEMG